jgi:GDP/UDP-N,N'-diacetylbacillosamine 2-epimerase (hydrolysing)
MSAAVQAGIPFGIPFVHLHGGETTLGAIDNIYRHQISLASVLHLTSTSAYSKKINQMLGNSPRVFAVGSLSLDGIEAFVGLEKDAFYVKYNIPKGDFILVTFHPETVNTAENVNYAAEMRQALSVLCIEMTIVITMPNADTQGSVYRSALYELKKEYPEAIILIENFGKINYFSAMRHACLMIGNTSSGILEAASFGKYVLNVGNRQEGRAQSENTFDTIFEASVIIETAYLALTKGVYTNENIYYKKGVAEAIIDILKSNA